MQKRSSQGKDPNRLVNNYLHLQSIFQKNHLEVKAPMDNLGFLNSGMQKSSDFLRRLLTKSDFHSVLVLRGALDTCLEPGRQNIVDEFLFGSDLSVRSDFVSSSWEVLD